MTQKKDNGQCRKDTSTTVIIPFRKTRPDITLEELLGGKIKSPDQCTVTIKLGLDGKPGEGIETEEGGKTKTDMEAHSTQLISSGGLFGFFEDDLMDSVFGTPSGADLYEKCLKHVLERRYGNPSHPPDSLDREAARMKAWQEWREECDIFRSWKPGRTIYEMPAITPEMLTVQGKEISADALCDTQFVPKSEARQIADSAERDAFLQTTLGKILFLEALGGYAKLSEAEGTAALVFTSEQVEKAKAQAWAKQKARQSVIVTHDTVFEMKAVRMEEAPEADNKTAAPLASEEQKTSEDGRTAGVEKPSVCPEQKEQVDPEEDLPRRKGTLAAILEFLHLKMH